MPASGKKIDELTNMGITIIKHPESDLIELWINNVFIAQANEMYINHHLEDNATVYQYYPDDEIIETNV